MPAPATTDEFVDLVRKSGVLENAKLDAYLDRLRAERVTDGPAGLARRMVQDGQLTKFQADQFMAGKWRRFFIGKYKVLEMLGQGGMGSVFLCEHKLMRRRVAVKVLPTAKAADPSSLERFYREARAVAALDHPNIVRAYDIDQDDKLHFLVMEYVDGASLQEIIKKSGPMDVVRAAHYMRQGAQGLQHAHETAGLVHRDIKPGNLLVDRNGLVKILDMGLARFFHDEEDILTKKYDENVLGTADYLAPEQAIDSHAADIRADIYSLGATFYFCLTGRTPFTEGSVAQKLIWHQTRQPKPIRSLRPEVPGGLAEVIEKMMAKDPAQRYQTPHEVADALIPFTQTAIGPPPAQEMPQLSPAAMGGGNAVPPSDTTLGSGGPGSVKKNWQVPTSPSPAARKPAAAPAPAPRPQQAATASPVRATPAKAAAPATRTVGNNGRVAVQPKTPPPAPVKSPAASKASAPKPKPVAKTVTAMADEEAPTASTERSVGFWAIVAVAAFLIAGGVFAVGMVLFK